MTQHLAIIEDVFDPASRIELDGDVRELLMGHFTRWPEGGHLYYETVAEDHEVVILDEADWDRLGAAEGNFIMVVNPQGLETILIASVVATLLVSVASFLLRPAVPSVSGTVSSSNNELSDRQNKARPLQRIPDVLGEVRSTPDLLGIPIKVFESKQEVEYAYLCIGRGAYEVTDIRDDTTLVSELAGASCAVYGPNTSPLSGDVPQIQIGDPIAETLVSAQSSTAINGQVLYAPNYKSVDMQALNIGGRFQVDGKITAPAMNWIRYFENGDVVTITGASYDDGDGHVVNLDGTYTVLGVEDDNHRLIFDHPELVNSDWTTIGSMTDQRTDFLFPLIEVPTAKTIGPFTMDVADLTEIWANLVASGGLYSVDSGGNQQAIDVDVEMYLTPLNADGTPRGDTETFSYTVEGASTTRSLLGKTCKATPTFSGKCNVSIKRITPTDVTDGLQVVDELKWRDLYAISPVGLQHFGNVTTVYSRSLATPAALGLKERKLNMNVVRKVPSRDGDGFSAALTASKSVADIFCFAALDPYIGGRSLAELDVAQIYDEVAEVVSYFGTAEAAEFGYTFDDDGVSFEETATSIADAAFCTARRLGSKISLFFEKATNDSTLMFNHRNKKPGSETRTISFGPQNDNDGVEYNWVDKDNLDGPSVYRIPVDGSALKPKKIDSVGQRNFSQAYWHAWREYNKIIHQHCATQFTATQEAALVGTMERILVADNTRSGTQDGEVRGQDGLVLSLSQKVVFEAGKSYTIFLQIPNGTIDAIGISPGDTAKKVVLARAPVAALSLDYDRFARATYWIVSNDDGREQAFLVSENTPADSGTYQLSAVNYDARYYEKDHTVPV